MKSDVAKLSVALFTPVALVTAVLYLLVYWYSFDIAIFDFLSFGGLITYCIMPFIAALGILLTSFFLVLFVPVVEKVTGRRRPTAVLIILGLFALPVVGQTYSIGLHVLWLFLPLIGAPLAAVLLDFIKRGHSLLPDPNIRFGVYFSVCLVLFSAVTYGKVRAGGVRSRTDYYTITIEKESASVRWIYLGKADNLVFLLSEKDGSIVVNKVDSMTPFVLAHHLSNRAPR